MRTACATQHALRKKSAVFKTLHILRSALPSFVLFVLLTSTLDWQSLWWDEGISLHLATSPWAEVVTNRAANIHPPLYFFVLKLWLSIVGRTPFAARYLSALAATLLPSAVYTFLRHRFDARVGRGVALLVALAPPFFIYGQEVRAYAFLPLLALALLAQVWQVNGKWQMANWPITVHVSRSTQDALRLAFIQTVFILTHYSGVIAVGWANLALLVQCIRAKDRQKWRAWLLSVGLTVLFALPWIIAVLAAGAVGLQKEAGLSNVLAEPLPRDYFLRLIAIFHAIGLPEAMADGVLWSVVLLVGVLLFVTTAYCVLRVLRIAYLARRFSVPLLPRSLAAWLLPLTAAPLIWRLSPQAHPRYLLPFVLGGWLLAGVLATSRHIPRLLRGALLAALLVMSVLGLRAYLTDSRYARSDVRAAAAYIRNEAQSGDVVLLPHTDWSLAQYDLGAARSVMVSPRRNVSDRAVIWAVFDTAMLGRRVYLLDYDRDALDPTEEARMLLEWIGYPVMQRDFHGVFVQQFDVATKTLTLKTENISPPVCIEETSLCLRSKVYQLDPEAGAAFSMQLGWEGGPTKSRYAVGLRLYAESGAIVASADKLLLDFQQRPTDLWSGENITTFHLIPLPPGLAPYSYRIEVGVYDVAAPDKPLSLVSQDALPRSTFLLGYVTPVIEPALTYSAYGLPDGPDAPSAGWDAGLHLVGATVDRTPVHPGQKVFVMLNWRWGTALPDDVPSLRLMQDGRVLAEALVLADLPAMPEGRPVLEYLALTVLPEAGDGFASVQLVSDEQSISLEQVTLIVGEHTFVVPNIAYSIDSQAGDVATLLGYELTPDTVVKSSAPVTLTLVWRAQDGAVDSDLTVFVHLVAPDGRIVAQHDGKPGDWTRPTTGWLPGEIIEDRHVLSWSQEYTGPAELRVGLYDAATGERVLWADGRDAVVLASSLVVE